MNETTNTTEWITLRQAGELHGVSRQTVLAWIKKGWILSGTRVGWQFVVDRAEIVAYVPRRGGYKNAVIELTNDAITHTREQLRRMEQNIEQTGDDITRVSSPAKADVSPEPTADGLPAVLGGEDATRTSPAHQF